MKQPFLRPLLVPCFILVVAALGHGQALARSQARQPQAAVTRVVTSVRIYLVAIEDQGRSGRKIGCGDSLVAVTRPVAATRAPLSAAMQLLLSDHHRFHGRSGLYNALYRSHLRLQRATVQNAKARIYLIGTMRLGGVCDDPRVKAQLRQTALQFRTVRQVAIFVNGIPLSKRLSEKGHA